MADNTGIEWTDATWNPVTGCDEVSPGCDHCYAKTLAERFRGTPGHYFENGFDVQLRPERLDQPIRWKRPRMIFVNSMSDLFHKDVPDEFILGVFAVMAEAKQHTFQVLTKRHGRMRSLLTAWQERIPWLAEPLPNVWLGVSVEDQQRADLRVPALLDTPAAVRWISAEPLLGSVDIFASSAIDREPGLDWVVVGGESGKGARPMHPNWARSLRDQCAAAGVPFLFKQWGEWLVDEYIDGDGCRHVGPKPRASDPKTLVIHTSGMTALTPDNPFDPWERGHPNWHTVMRRVGKKAAGRVLDGETHDGYPKAAA